MARWTAEPLPFAEMSAGGFIAVSSVPREGYQWITGRPVTRRGPGPVGRWLVEAAPPDEKRWADRSAPLQRRDLPLAFEGLKATEDAILAFANRYGPLIAAAVHVVPADGGPTVVGESLARWQEELRRYRLLRRLWGLVRDGSPQAQRTLEPFVIWSAGKDRVTLRIADNAGEMEERLVKHARAGSELEPAYLSTQTWDAANDQTGRPDLLRRWRRNPVLGPVRFYVFDQVDRQLKGRVNLRTIPYAGRHGTAEPRLEVVDLLGVLYVRFQLDLIQNTDEPGTKTCEYAGCMVPIRGRAHYCVEHRPVANRERRRRAWHAHPEYNERRKVPAKSRQRTST
jgi:hypothetical protein